MSAFSHPQSGRTYETIENFLRVSEGEKELKARSKTTSWNQGDGSIGIKANESVELGVLRASRK
jgi:hypothetical protein